jgi:P-type conjugative transfer protein TrbJ
MKRKLITILAFGSILLPIASPPNIFGGIPIGLPAQGLTQLLNYGQLVKQLITSAQQLQQAFAQVQWMVYNSKNLVQHPFTSIMSDLTALGNIIAQSQGLAYTMGGLDKQFATMYPTYDPHQQWFSTYANWSVNTMKTLQGTLGAAGFQGMNLMNEQASLQQLRTMTATPMGQNQAAQIGAIASEEVASQLVKLRQLMIADQQAKAAVVGMQVNQENAKQQATVNGFPGTDWDSDNRSFGLETGTAPGH